MDLFVAQVLAGIATGAIYACVALAVVMMLAGPDPWMIPPAAAPPSAGSEAARLSRYAGGAIQRLAWTTPGSARFSGRWSSACQSS